MTTKESNVNVPENPYAERLREAVVTIRELRAERDELLSLRDEPIAVIGLGCRFPGGGHSPAAFWRALENGVDGIREIPAERWPSEAIPGNRPQVKFAGLLDNVDAFDAEFFDITPREAESLDPQQRLLLEVAWEALEDAYQRPDMLVGSLTGVFVGVHTLDYQQQVIARGLERFDHYCATGNMLSTASGRLSYALGLQGPAVTTETACSSSLTAIAVACQSLRAGDATMAIAGGANLLLSPANMALLAATRALSPDGRCRTLDARANGFVRGEGCGLVILKRLSNAKKDGDRIRAVIRGWAVNQDGRSTGLTTPNVLSQQALLRHALQKARLSAGDIGYVEMHGTGTPLGDPIEVDALKEVLGKPRTDGSKCVLGAVKTNIGHLESAAGVAGVIKVMLSFEHERIPKNLHFRNLNPRISLDGTPFTVPTETVPWKRGDKRRVAGVSSFGFSGTNAHVILEEAPPDVGISAAASRPVPRSLPLILSGLNSAATSAQAARLAEHIEGEPKLRVLDLAYSLATTRTHFPVRRALVVAAEEQPCELAANLRKIAAGENLAAAYLSSDGRKIGRLTALFPSEGAQRAGMGRELWQKFPAYREAFDEVCRHMDRHLDRLLADVIFAKEGSPEAALLHQTKYTQPALFTIGVALYRLLQHWGIAPEIVAGHSIGEITAAYVAGIFSLPDACELASARGSLMLMDGMQDAFRRVANRLSYQPPQLTLISSATGKRASAEDLSSPEYWVQQARRDGRFLDGARSAHAEGATTFVELGPGETLCTMLDTCLPEGTARCVPSLRKGQSEVSSITNALAALFVSGIQINWDALFGGLGARRVALPTYPFQRKRFWLESKPRKQSFEELLP
jgi:acyl transferase domain-containing protein